METDADSPRRADESLMLCIENRWSAKDGGEVAAANEEVEEELKISILFSVFLYKMMKGFGKLAFVWATVVLLGGFATLIKQQDFWFVTTIAFIQKIGFEHPFATSLPTALDGYEKFWACERSKWRRDYRFDSNQMRAIPIRICRTCSAFLITISSLLAIIAAHTALLTIPSMRLSKQDFVDLAFLGHDDHRNIRQSLNIFYGLVLVQGICGVCSVLNSMLRSCGSLTHVIDKYGLGILGKVTLKRYLDYVTTGYGSGNVRSALKLDLLSFAMELARSNSVDDQLLGVWTILDIVLACERDNKRVHARRDNKRVHARLLASPETLDRLVRMLAGLGGEGEDRTRGPAARIVRSLAPEILSGRVPGLLHFTSSLLCERDDGDMDYIWLGLNIVNELMGNPDNHRYALEADSLLSKVIDLTNLRDHGDHNRNMTSNSSEIVAMSLEVLQRLVAINGEAGKVLKRDFAENLEFLSNTCRMIKEKHVKVMSIVACCTLDDKAREEFGNSPEIIKELKACLLSVQQVEEHSEVAAEALALLTMDIKSNVVAVLEEIDSKEMQQVVDMLFVADGGKRASMVAKLLHNLRAYSGTEYTDQPHRMQVIDKALPEVLKAIIMGVNKLEESANTGHHPSNIEEGKVLESYAKTDDGLTRLKIEEGKVLESFVGLSVQICASRISSDLAGNHEISCYPTIDILVQKLKKILQIYGSPTTDIPGIRRVTIELMIWLMQSDGRNIKSFWSFKVADELEEVARTARKLENFSLFYNGVGVAKYSKPVSCVARAALALLAGEPTS